MQKKHIIIYLLLSFVALSSVSAQTTNLLERNKVSLSPSESRFDSYTRDMDVRQDIELYSNPTYYEWTHTHDSIFNVGRYRNAVYMNYGNGELQGDFLTYEGNAFYDTRLGASGEYALKKAGVLFGQVQYSMGRHKNIGWNAMRSPELYLPYIATDSIGGDYRYEDYSVRGGYAFTIKGWKLGVNGLFHGEQAHRKSDPRVLNKTTWLNIGVGTSYMYKHNLFMYNISYGRNKQHVHNRYWRPGEQDRFFVCYGFGLYDIRRSVVSFGYSRMYYINEVNMRLTYQSPADLPLSVYASLGYEFDHMKTEETDIVDLYHSRTHTFLPTVRLDYRPSKSWKLSLWLEGDINLRKGYENIFERYMSDPYNFIYDYRLIDTQQKYDFQQTDALAQLRVRYNVTKCHTVGLKGGVSYALRDERYIQGRQQITNSSIFPHGEVYYRMMVKRSELELSCMYGEKLNVENTYKVKMNNTKVAHLDFQHAFTQYAYFNSTFNAINAQLSYVYHFKKCALGATGKVMYTDGHRGRDAVYTGEIGFDSTAPKISKTPDKHGELWGSASIFVTF